MIGSKVVSANPKVDKNLGVRPVSNGKRIVPVPPPDSKMIAGTRKDIRGKWQPFVPHEFCSTDITNAAHTLSKQPPRVSPLLMKVRKQLFSLGWRIQYTRVARSNIIQFRYISPDQHKCYLSIRWLFEDLRNSTVGNSANVCGDLKERKRKRHDNGWHVRSEDQNPRKEKRLKVISRIANRRVNDNICSVCHERGELLLCDECPSSYHMACLGLNDFPKQEFWSCPSCCCGLCGQSKFKESPSRDGVLSCKQCRLEFHVGCVRSRGNGPDNWFCSQSCKDICANLHHLLGRPIPAFGGHKNLTWRLLNASDDEAMLKYERKLKAAVDVLHECFETAKDDYNGRDIVEDVNFNRFSVLKRLNFRGFYTVVVEEGNEVISVANLRVHDRNVAELPLVATKFQYRKLGMCRALMDVLERQLVKMGVEKLVLPSAPCALNTWTDSFGFTKMTDTEKLKYVNCTFLNFPDTIMCQKSIKRIRGRVADSRCVLGSSLVSVPCLEYGKNDLL